MKAKRQAIAWSEHRLARILARNTFAGDLCVLDNCTWTGNEVDLLVVTPAGRIVDVEIKISRADLKADKGKGKWWHQPWGEFVGGNWVSPPRVPRAYPLRTWKHYYAMPAEIWREDLLEHVQPVSGVLLVSEGNYDRGAVECIKRAKPSREDQPITDVQLVALARLTSLRLWDSYLARDRLSADYARMQRAADADAEPMLPAINANVDSTP